MADNKDKIERIHDLLPKAYNSRRNPNWKALIEAIGDADQQTADLVAEVRKQFFIKTANRPYLDRLGANNKVSRPRLVGMDDTSFREYIPVLSYKPKQVKLIIDELLDIFFFKESTTAYVTSSATGPFTLDDEWELEYLVDELNQERVIFRSDEFTDISNATADEIVAAINRQSKYSYATTYYDSITKKTYVRLFTNTIGSKGSIRFQGGRAATTLRFDGFISNAGNGGNTTWTITKIGDTVTMQHTAGNSPALDNLRKGDIVISMLPNNVGSFIIDSVDIFNNSITFVNLFGTAGIYTQTIGNEVKFLRPNKYAAYLNKKRAMTWETEPGKISIEMPTSPPVVRRSLKGSIHVNGAETIMSNRVSNNSLTVENATAFPNSGSFIIEPVNEIVTRWQTISENTVGTNQFNGRLQYKPQKYEYTSRTVLTTTGDIVEGSNQITNLASIVGLAIGQTVFMTGFRGDAIVTSIAGNTANISIPSTRTSTGAGVSFGGNTLTGITPTLPNAASLNEFSLVSLQRNGSNTGIGTTSVAHLYQVGEYVVISGSSGAVDTLNGSWLITAVPSPTSFEFYSYGQSTGGNIATPGSARVERSGLTNAGSKLILVDSVSSETTRIKGSYLYDPAAAFVLSDAKATISDNVQAGKLVRILNIGTNSIPNKDGFVVFDFGLNTQEGPVRYLYKPTDNTLAIDPSYLFKYNHSIGSTVTAINRKGPHHISTNGSEYAGYITDPSEARIILQELIKSVKSAGIFIDFIIRFPEQLYATLDVYQSGQDPG